MATNGEKKAVDDGIANSHEQEQVLRGVQPKHQIAYKIYKFCKIYMILGLFFAVLLYVLKLVPVMNFITKYKIYTYIEMLINPTFKSKNLKNALFLK